MKKFFHNLTTISFVLQAGAIFYLGLLLFLFSNWFLNDNDVINMTDADWVEIGVRRIVFFSLFALVYALFTYLVNRLLVARSRYDIKNKHLGYLSLAYFLVLFFCTLVGGLLFIFEKPFI